VGISRTRGLFGRDGQKMKTWWADFKQAIRNARGVAKKGSLVDFFL
jgi:hypothetical protein